jgi:ATP-dependent helicase/nuclease subunit A
MQLTDEQKAAITARGPRIVVAAGAGSGKTRVLVKRIVCLLEDGVDLDAIAAITFTEKAASEMKARLREEFRAHASTRDAAAMSRWRNYERMLDAARISTIHSFCMRLLKENTLYLSLDPDFSLLTEAQSSLLQRDVVRDTLRELLRGEDPAILRLARERTFRDLTTLLTGLIPQLPHLTKLAREWPIEDPDGIAELWKVRANDVLMAEVQSYGWQLRLNMLRHQLHRFDGLCTNPEDGREARRRFLIEQLDCLLSQPPAPECLSRVCAAVSNYHSRQGSRKNWPEEGNVYERLSKIQDTAKGDILELCALPECNEEDEAECAQSTAALLQVCLFLDQRLREAKDARAVLNFDDLLTRTRDALDADPALASRAAAGLRHLLMDEFQDTDHTQLAIAEALCNVEGGPSLFVVGDAKQSIYRFRGAEVEVFGDVRRGVEVLPLAQNFRSASGILHFVNDFFAQSGLLGAVEPDFMALQPHREGAPGPDIEFLLSPRGSTPKDTAKDARKREAQLIARRIRALCNGPAIVWDAAAKQHRQPRPGDFAILLRALSNVHIYTEALSAEGVEFGVVAGADFFERQEVLDILNTLKIVLDPFDEPALLAVLRGPFCALRDDTLALLCRDRPLPAAFWGDLVPEGIADPEALAGARALLEELRSHASDSSAEFLQVLLERTHCEAGVIALPGGVQRASNLRKLADIAAEFTAGGEPSLRRFTSYLDEMRSAAVREGDALLQPQEGGAVTIMSVHRSKGLEFPVVILADCTALNRGDNRGGAIAHHRALGAVLPSAAEDGATRSSLWAGLIKRRNGREEMDEHARLLYVALTRARDYLILAGGGQPVEKSWLGLMDHTFGIMDRADGSTFGTDTWQARICHSVEDAPAPAGNTTDGEESAPRWEEVFAHAEKTLPKPPAAASLPVSALLDCMMPGLGAEEDREPTPEPAGDAALVEAAMTRGSLVHRLFELWDFQGPAPVDRVMQEAAASPRERARWQEDLQKIASAFAHQPLCTELAQAQTLLREHPFVLRAGQILVRGTIDALLNGDTIIDYKTGRRSEEKAERYRWQLHFYAAAVRELTGVLPARALLAWVDQDSVEEFPVRPEEVEQALRTASTL